MATLTATERTEDGVLWMQVKSGLWESSDGRWRCTCVIREPRSRRTWLLETNDGDGWKVVEPFPSMTAAKLWVAQAIALEEKSTELWIDEAQMEGGNGTIVRLRLMRGDDVVREVIVRDGHVIVEAVGMTSKLTGDEAIAFATMVMQAAQLVDGGDA